VPRQRVLPFSPCQRGEAAAKLVSRWQAGPYGRAIALTFSGTGWVQLERDRFWTIAGRPFRCSDRAAITGYTSLGFVPKRMGLRRRLGVTLSVRMARPVAKGRASATRSKSKPRGEARKRAREKTIRQDFARACWRQPRRRPKTQSRKTGWSWLRLTYNHGRA